MRDLSTESDFSYWLKTAREGERATYYRGFLMRDREVYLRGGGFTDSFPPAIKTAIAAWRAYMNGEVKLIQKREGTYDYKYIAIKG